MTSKDKYSVESFMEFAEKRIKGEKGNKVSIYNTAQVPSIRKMSCPFCRKPHALHGCKEFRENGARDRRQFVSSRSGVCFNCLSTRHQVAECPDKRRCSHCEGKHHTLFHQPKQTETSINVTTEGASSEDELDDESKIAINMSIGIEKVILPTISVLGTYETILTALLDTGAQISIITPQALRRLGKNIKVTNLVRLIKIRGVVDNRSIIIEKCVKLH
jgi:hypothetical protein